MGLMVSMPLLVALHVALIAATTALIGVPHRYARLLAAVLMSSPAILTLGVVLQLVAQVLGLILLALSCVLCLSPFYRLRTGRPRLRVPPPAPALSTWCRAY